MAFGALEEKHTLAVEFSSLATIFAPVKIRALKELRKTE